MSKPNWKEFVTAEIGAVVEDFNKSGEGVSSSTAALHEAHLLSCKICEQIHKNHVEFDSVLFVFLKENGLFDAAVKVFNDPA